MADELVPFNFSKPVTMAVLPKDGDLYITVFGTAVFRRFGTCQHLGLANYLAAALRSHEFVRNRRRDEVRIVLLMRPKPTLFATGCGRVKGYYFRIADKSYKISSEVLKLFENVRQSSQGS